MPAQGRTSLASTASAHLDEDDSEGSKSEGDHDEFVYVDLGDIRKDVQCPICLGIIRKTRTVMECLHRFCRECIDKSMRLGNNECPVCRTHCASRRSLRDDLNFDALIAALYPNLDNYEEEELAIRDEDKRRNRQLQASIAETSLRQSDAIARRCTNAKGLSLEDAPREKRLRRRKRKAPNYLFETSVRMDEASDEEQVEVQQENTWPLTDGRIGEELRRESLTANAGRRKGLATWARAGARSQVRYGNLPSGNSRHVQCMRATVLHDSIAAAAQLENETQFDVQFILQPLSQVDNDEKLPSLEKPYLCCPANVTVQHICKFLVNRLFPAPTKDLELLVGNECSQPELSSEGKLLQSSKRLVCTSDAKSSKAIGILHPQNTLGQIHTSFWDFTGNLVLMYRLKA